MYNLSQNYKIILEELTRTCSYIESFSQIRQTKLSNLKLVALILTSEYMSYDSELQLFRTLKGTELETKIERSVYNKRCRKLKSYIEQVCQCLSQKFSHLSNLFIIDSTHIEICRMSRAKRSNICATDNIQPAFVYCAAQKKYYFGYKLHLVCDDNAVIHSFDFTPANIHDINYLNDVKHNLNNCELIGDRGYISSDYKADSLSYSKIKLSVHIRSNTLTTQESSLLNVVNANVLKHFFHNSTINFV